MTRNILKIVALFFVAVIGGIFGGQVLWPYLVDNSLYEFSNQPSIYNITKKEQVFIQENTALQGAIERASKSVIAVRSKTESGTLTGSGLIVTSDGLAVTLAKLVPQGFQFSFFVEGSQVGFQIVKRDLKENLALIKLDRSNLATAAFADLNKIKLGQRVFLVANVFKADASSTEEVLVLANQGIIRSFDGDVISTNIVENEPVPGSPLFDIEGAVLGIHAFDPEGKAIIIPISEVKAFAGI